MSQVFMGKATSLAVLVMMFSRSPLKLIKSSVNINLFLARGYKNVAPVPLATWQKEKKEFNKTLPDFINGILDNKLISDVPLASQRLRDVLEHILSSGRKRIRPMILLFANKMLTKPEHQTPDNLKLCQQLAWLTELMHSIGTLMDDIMDNSEVRENLPCWHLIPGAGDQVLNDVAMLVACLQLCTYIHIGDRECYKDITKSFVEIMLQSCLGQHLDTQTRVQRSGFEMFTAVALKKTHSLKIGLYTFGLPINWVLFMNNCRDKNLHQQVNDIAGEIGYIYQSRNDILDCYGEADTGRAGVDIQNGTMTWLAVKAMELASPSQLADFKSCYGREDQESGDAVKHLYQTLDLQELFKDEERQMHKSIMKMAQEMPGEFEPLYVTILDRIYQRNI